jgi:putative ABC transport system permease protein
MLGKILALVVGIVLGTTLLTIVLGLTVSMLVVGSLALVTLVKRDGVPVIYNVRSLTARKVTTLVTGLGLGLVVTMFTLVLMFSGGVKRTLVSTGEDLNAKIIRKGSVTEIQSGVMPENERVLGSQPEVAIAADGKPLSSPELVVLIFALRNDAKDDTEGTNLVVRGAGTHALELHPPKKLDGRLWKPGTSEIIIGKNLVGRFQGSNLGGTFKFARRDWQVVGIADHGGTAYDSEIWGDVEQVMDAFQRRPAFSSITMRLKDRNAWRELEKRMSADPQLNTLEIKPEIDYWAAQSEQMSKFVNFLGLFIAIIFSFAAVLGAMITMYAQVAARTREIGTLRAIGFQRRSVLVSFVIESVLLSLAAGGVGVGVASAMQSLSFTTMNWQTFSEVTFRFYLSPTVIVAAFIFSTIIGYAGGLLPAIRAARMPIVQATRGG